MRKVLIGDEHNCARVQQSLTSVLNYEARASHQEVPATALRVDHMTKRISAAPCKERHAGSYRASEATTRAARGTAAVTGSRERLRGSASQAPPAHREAHLLSLAHAEPYPNTRLPRPCRN